MFKGNCWNSVFRLKFGMIQTDGTTGLGGMLSPHEWRCTCRD